MTLGNLYCTMMSIRDRYHFDSLGDIRGGIETVAHELAHAIDLDGVGLSSGGIGNWIEEFGDRAANNHELRTLRIEVESLRRLGHRFSLRELVQSANWRYDEIPQRSRWTAPLTRRERRGVTQFVRIVRDAARRVA